LKRVLVALLVAGIVSPAAAEASPAGLAQRVKAAVAPLGGGAAVQVIDLSTRRTVAAVRARRRQPLGSTAKLLTAAAALRRLGPDTTLGTSVVATAPAAGLVSVLRRLRASASFTAALARPGRAGTLRDRLTSGRTRRACRGKTGTLPSGGVSALAGYCAGRNRHTYAFAVLVRGRATGKARRAQDRVARALAAAR
jgi:D-alanyl-D-alanine carboxypeptidase